MQRKFGGTVIDIVSREIRTPEQQSEALNAVKSTVLEIFIIVVVGYDLFFHVIIRDPETSINSENLLIRGPKTSGNWMNLLV